MEIGTIAILVMGKLFQDYESVDSYCQAYQETYDKMVSRFINNKGGHNQNKHYEVFFQGAILKRLLKAYTLLVATINIK